MMVPSSSSGSLALVGLWFGRIAALKPHSMGDPQRCTPVRLSITVGRLHEVHRFTPPVLQAHLLAGQNACTTSTPSWSLPADTQSAHVPRRMESEPGCSASRLVGIYAIFLRCSTGGASRCSASRTPASSGAGCTARGKRPEARIELCSRAPEPWQRPAPSTPGQHWGRALPTAFG